MKSVSEIANSTVNDENRIILSSSFDEKQINSEWIEKDKYLESNYANDPDGKIYAVLRRGSASLKSI